MPLTDIACSRQCRLAFRESTPLHCPEAHDAGRPCSGSRLAHRHWLSLSVTLAHETLSFQQIRSRDAIIITGILRPV